MKKVGVLGLALLLVGCVAVPVARKVHDPDALWRIVSTRCEVAHADTTRACAAVWPEPGRQAALLKDRQGQAQYLLLPLRKVTGIEDPHVLAADAPNYFGQAWRARDYAERALGQPLPRRYASLSANSPHGRSQEQLHIHIDCIRADVAEALQRQAASIGDRFAPLPERLRGHVYLARYLPGAELTANPLRLLAQALPAGETMADYTLVVVGAEDGRGAGFVLLATRFDPTHGNFASGEELQDHACGAITGAPPLDGVW